MKSVRLTKDIRRKILAAAIERAGFQAKFDGIRGREEKLAEQVWRRVIPEDVEREAKKIDARIVALNKKAIHPLSSRQFRFDSGLSFYLNGYRRSLSFINDDARLVPNPGLEKLKLTASEEKTLIKIDQDREKVDAQLKNIRSQIEVLCGNVGTTGRLVEIWPEAEQLLPLVEEKTSIAVPVKELNEVVFGSKK